MIWHSTQKEEVAERFSVNTETGLTSQEAAARLEKYGKNILASEKKKSFFARFIDQMKDFMVIILLLAAALSMVVTIIEQNGEWFEPIIIIAIVLANAFLGVYQEAKAENALEALKSMTAPQAKVIRDGNTITIDSADLVRGDIIVLEAGDYIPADARLVSSFQLRCDESPLTGESVPVEKDADTTVEDIAPLGDRVNMLYSGCSVTNGRAVAIVTETGMYSEVGKIASLLEQTGETETPLKSKLNVLGKVLGIVTLVICAIVFAVGLLRNYASGNFINTLLDMFMTSVSLAVAAIPEGLPAIVTVVLALGVQRMVKHNAIIKNLPAVETLGSASVICSDKTGTLTLNRMTVTKVFTANTLTDLETESTTDSVSTLLRLGAICTDTKVVHNGSRRSDIGDPTEIAITDACEKYVGVSKTDIDASFPRFAELPFDSERKLMTTVNVIEGKAFAIVKGAPEILLSRCVECDEKSVLEANEEMAKHALRVIAVAIKPLEAVPADATEDLEHSLTFVGLIGMIDPPRPEAVKAVSLCHKAGISTVMITGDHITTAKAIAEKLGILTPDKKAITGAELSQMSDEEFFSHIDEYAVYARVTPEDKIRIVKAWQQKDKIVSMTGDGVNDAPALKAADIGCAMGITGTDVAKGASDMILTDDNFSTIVTAVKEGRGIFENIRKAVRFLVSCNISEILIVFFGMMIYGAAPLTAVQLLWINLVTDSAPALALGMEPAEDDVMDTPPRDVKEQIFTKPIAITSVLHGIVFTICALISFAIGKATDLITAETMAFCTVAFAQIFYVLAVRSEHAIIKANPFKNKYLIYAMLLSIVLMIIALFTPLNVAFGLVSMTVSQFLTAFGLALVPLAVFEGYKGIRYLRNKNK